jgi:hypothetical protein
MVKDNMSRFEEALNKDLGRPMLEARLWVQHILFDPKRL